MQNFFENPNGIGTWYRTPTFGLILILFCPLYRYLLKSPSGSGFDPAVLAEKSGKTSLKNWLALRFQNSNNLPKVAILL